MLCQLDPNSGRIAAMQQLTLWATTGPNCPQHTAWLVEPRYYSTKIAIDCCRKSRGSSMRRRDFIAAAGSVAAWPPTARAQQLSLPVIGFVALGSADLFLKSKFSTAFGSGLATVGYVEGRNMIIEYHFLEDDRSHFLSTVMSDLVSRRVTVIVAISPNVAIAAKAATTTIPIIFAADQDPAKLGIVDSFARPGGNATGISFLLQEVSAKRLELLRRLIPSSVRIAVLVNPSVPSAIATVVPQVREAARVLGLQIDIVNASNSIEIDTVFSTFAHSRPDALFVTADTFFASRAEQLINLAARSRIPASYGNRDNYVDIGGLMSYGANLSASFRQVGVYAGSILKGTNPADLPVVQPTKFEFVINLQTARLLGIEVPPMLLALTDDVIE